MVAFTRHLPSVRGAPRLALVHSLALDRSIWDGVIERLATDAEIVTYDCRGHGASDRRAVPFTVDLFAADLAALLDWLGWDRAAIAGCSMGGCVTQAFAASHPSRASRVALIDTTAWYGADAVRRWQDRAAAARTGGLAGLVSFQVTRWFSDEFRATHPEVLDRTASVFVSNDFDCYAASCGLLGDVDVRAHLSSFQMPTAIVVGEEDYATPVAMARQLHEAIPHSTLTILSKARHLTPIEQPDAIADVVFQLLQQHT
jgi:3-oxoadipate enol-lactonase